MFRFNNSSPAMIQDFSLPSSTIYWIKKNPSTPKCYKKMLETCKYFYSPQDPIPISNLEIHRSSATDVQWDASIFGHSVKYLQQNNPLSKFIEEEGEHQIWLCGRLKIFDLLFNLPKLIQSIHRWDLTAICFYDQNLSFDEFKILTSSNKFEHFHTQYCKIKYQNGESVPPETIIENLPNLKIFDYNVDSKCNAGFSGNTVSRIIQLLNTQKVKRFSISGCIPECFDFQTFYDFMKKNPQIVYHLVFLKTYSEGYTQNLQNAVTEILAKGKTENPSPFLTFSAGNKQDREDMWKLWGQNILD